MSEKHRQLPSPGFLLSTLHVDMSVIERAVLLTSTEAWSYAVLPLQSRLLVLSDDIATMNVGAKAGSMRDLRDAVSLLRFPTTAAQLDQLVKAYAKVRAHFADVSMA
jgi:hypothetical protein